MKLTVCNPHSIKTVATKSASASQIPGVFMHDLRALQVKRHRAVSWERAHCYTLIPLQSVSVDAGSRCFYANLLSTEFAVQRCCALWHANSTCTYLYSATSVSPPTLMSNVQGHQRNRLPGILSYVIT